MRRVQTSVRLTAWIGVTQFLAVLAVSAESEGLRRPASEIRVSPAAIRLDGHNRRQQILVTAIDSTQQREFDVTHHCQLLLSDESLAPLRGTTLVAARDGQTELVVRYGDLQRSVPVVVEQMGAYPPVHFRNDVMPLFAKLGCSSGGCHGKQSGQNGFRLSVFGFDPQADYGALVKEARGRRVFPGDPDRSLLILKATGRLPHGGGARTELNSPDAETLAQWVRQGMPWGAESSAALTGIRVEPPERIMTMDSDQQILVTALFSDGSQRDVTGASAFISNTETVAEVDATGRVRTGQRPGEAAVTINYMGQVTAARVIVPREARPSSAPASMPDSRLDELVWDKLQKLGLVSADQCDDTTFFRRIHVHAIGTLPTSAEVRSFLQDASPTRRSDAIDRVLQRPEFADYWALKWADILLVNRQRLGERGAYEFHHWLREQFARNRPYDEWVRELLTATGDSGKYGPVNFYRAVRTPEDLAKSVSQAVLGVRMDCAQCHHHPFDRWGQDDFYGLAGYFNGLARKELSLGRELVYHTGLQVASLPLTGQKVLVRPPGGTAVDATLLGDGDPRRVFAEWATDKVNPYFARLTANRLWKHFLGRGLVEPEDDLRSTNPATNEPLLEFLAQQVIASDFDLKAVMRQIMNSRVYQLSSAANEVNLDDDQNFSHFLVKRMPAEVLLDAISQVTDSPEPFAGTPLGTRAIQLWDNRLPSYFLDTFGRSERESPCQCGASGEPTMSQALHLMNAPEIAAKIADPAGRVARLTESGLPEEQLIEELCLAALGRPASEKECQVGRALFAQQPVRAAAEDFLWTLLNSYEFLFVK